jgi:acetyl-CoA synthetase
MSYWAHKVYFGQPSGVVSMKVNPKQMHVDEDLWREQGGKLPWFKPFTRVLDWQEPVATWFGDGELNASYACVDVHALGENKNKVAFYWEDEKGNQTSWTYAKLYQEVNKIADILKRFGVKQGDVVVIYMPMVLEAIATMLAVVRLGAAHTVVFSGFSSQSLKDRIEDTHARVVVTADVSLRRGKIIRLKEIVDNALINCPAVETVLVLQRVAGVCAMTLGRDHFLHNLVSDDAHVYVPPVAVPAMNPLFILYTSGTTGKPKGIIHSTGGYLAYVRAAMSWTFGTQAAVYWCTADLGWITGHSCVVYGPLQLGMTQLIYEGAPDFPHPGRWWELIEKYKVNTFYTSPTALRLFMRFGIEWVQRHDLSSLELLGSVGEVINPEVWTWYHEVVGQGQCPIIDTWWQTETGCFMIAPAIQLKNIDLKPGCATFALPGIEPEIVDAAGLPVPRGTKGFLVIKKPWPGMSIGIFGDSGRFKHAYWSKFPGNYYSGDYAMQDADGYFWLFGRADEVLNVAGHRIGTAEIESVVVTVAEVAEAAAVGVFDEVKGEAVVIFAILSQGLQPDDALKAKVVQAVREQIGAFVTPRGVFFVEKLPKTRSGKIMRRLLKAVVEGNHIGDVSTLEDEASIDEVRASFNEIKAALL